MPAGGPAGARGELEGARTGWGVFSAGLRRGAGGPGPLPGRSLYPALLSIELCIARPHPVSFSHQGLLYHLPRDRHGQTLGKESPRKRLHVSRS